MPLPFSNHYLPKSTVSTITAVQFRGKLDPGSQRRAILARATASSSPSSPSADLTLAGTFYDFPVREEPSRHPAELAVLVHTPTGSIPAFPGDWIVQDSKGAYSVMGKDEFAARFEATVAPAAAKPATKPTDDPPPAPAPISRWQQRQLDHQKAWKEAEAEAAATKAAWAASSAATAESPDYSPVPTGTSVAMNR